MVDPITTNPNRSLPIVDKEGLPTKQTIEWFDDIELKIDELLAVETEEGGGSQFEAGMGMDFFGSTAPSGWVLCDGAVYNSVADTSFADLFAVIGITHGGTGASNFQVPDLRGSVSIGLDNLGGNSANRMTNPQADVLGGRGGVEDVSLAEAQNGPHDHDYDTKVNLSSNVSTGIGGLGGVWSGGVTTATSTSSGDGEAHPNDQPWMAVTKIIKK